MEVIASSYNAWKGNGDWQDENRMSARDSVTTPRQVLLFK